MGTQDTGCDVPPVDLQCNTNVCHQWTLKSSDTIIQMEILGFTFDDSVFAETRDRVSSKPSSYNAKCCEPGWFCGEVSTDDDDDLEKQKVFKFRGDLAYRRRDYQKALSEYANCFALVPDSNIAIRRDVREALARCYCQLGRWEMALEIAQPLRKEATNMSHLTAVLNLEWFIYHSAGDLRKEISSVQQLVSLLPYNPWHWKKLAKAYTHLFRSLSGSAPAKTGRCHHRAWVMENGGPSAVPCPLWCLRKPPEEPQREGLTRSQEESESPQPDPGRGEPQETAAIKQRNDDLKDIWLRSCICFVRTRLLFHMVKFQQLSFVFLSNKRALEEIEDALHSLELQDEILHLITEEMSEDLVPEKMREESPEAENISSVTCATVSPNSDFEEKWFNRLKMRIITSEAWTAGDARFQKH
nr:PREDICTED: uncharacterized protein C8orf76-like isoform X1 [Lepisosteus oculatus]